MTKKSTPIPINETQTAKKIRLMNAILNFSNCKYSKKDIDKLLRAVNKEK